MLLVLWAGGFWILTSRFSEDCFVCIYLKYGKYYFPFSECPPLTSQFCFYFLSFILCLYLEIFFSTILFSLSCQFSVLSSTKPFSMFHPKCHFIDSYFKKYIKCMKLLIIIINENGSVQIVPKILEFIFTITYDDWFLFPSYNYISYKVVFVTNYFISNHSSISVVIQIHLMVL